MPEESGFFRWVWRFNALALAGVLVLAAAVGAAALYEIVRSVTADRHVSDLVDPAPEAEKATEERLGALTALGETGLLWTPLERRTRSALAYSSKQAAAVIDYLVYDPATGEGRLLLGRRPSLILEARMLRGARKDRAVGPDLALLARFVTEDGDGDGRFSAADPATLALATPQADGLAVIAEDVAVLGVAVLSDRLAVATVREGEGEAARTVALHLDLVARRLIRRVLLQPSD